MKIKKLLSPYCNNNFRKNLLKFTILLLTTLTLCSCGRSKEQQFYVLTPVPPQKSGHNVSNRLQIGIDGVTIPDSIKKSQLMINQTPHHLRIDEYSQWAGPLDKN